MMKHSGILLAGKRLVVSTLVALSVGLPFRFDMILLVCCFSLLVWVRNL